MVRPGTAAAGAGRDDRRGLKVPAIVVWGVRPTPPRRQIFTADSQALSRLVRGRAGMLVLRDALRCASGAGGPVNRSLPGQASERGREDDGLMDEPNDFPTPPEGSEGIPPTEPTPRASSPSWVPGAPLDEAGTPTVPLASAAGAEALPAPGASEVAAGPMPLSMPPFAASVGGVEHLVAPPAAAGEPPTAPPPGEGLNFAAAGGEPPGGAPHQRRRRPLVAAVVVAALLAGGLGAGLEAALGGGGSGSSAVQQLPTSSSSPPTSNPSATASGSRSIASIAASVEPGVVDIQTTVVSAGGLEPAAGTGMIVTPSGEVLTNNHVVEDASSIKVSIAGRSGTYSAKVLGTDVTKDVALLQIEGVSNLPYVTLGDSSTVAVGDQVIAIGNALGLGGKPSVVSGGISATGRTITASDSSGALPETLHGMLETSAPIAPGDSGGPLVNMKGQVIGMDTAAASADGTGSTIGFAIPINTAKTIVQQIERGQASSEVTIGESPFLGVYQVPGSSSGGFGSFGSTTTPSTGTAGVTISGVIQNSPAAKAGLQGGDVIASVDGHTTDSWSALQSQIAAHLPGDQLTVHYVDQSGTAHTATVQLAGLPK